MIEPVKKYREESIDWYIDELIFGDDIAKYGAAYYDDIGSILSNILDSDLSDKVSVINDIYNRTYVVVNDKCINPRRRLLVGLRSSTLITQYMVRDMKSYNATHEVNEILNETLRDLFIPWLNMVSRDDMTLDLMSMDNMDCCIMSSSMLFCCVTMYGDLYDRYSTAFRSMNRRIRHGFAKSDDKTKHHPVISMQIAMVTSVWGFISYYVGVSDWLLSDKSNVDPHDYVDLFIMYWNDNGVQPAKWLVDVSSIEYVAETLFVNCVAAIMSLYTSVDDGDNPYSSVGLVRLAGILESSAYVLSKMKSSGILLVVNGLSRIGRIDGIITDLAKDDKSALLISAIKIADFILSPSERNTETANAVMRTIKRHKMTSAHYAMLGAYMQFMENMSDDIDGSCKHLMDSIYQYNRGAYDKYIH